MSISPSSNSLDPTTPELHIPQTRTAVSLNDALMGANLFYATQGDLVMVLSLSTASLAEFIQKLTQLKMAQLDLDSDKIKNAGSDADRSKAQQQYNEDQLDWDKLIEPFKTAEQTNQSAQNATTQAQGSLSRDMGAVLVVWQLPQSQ